MVHTEKQILEKAKLILKDLKGKNYKEECIRKISFNKEKMVLKPEEKIIPAWTVSINSLFENIDFLTISDETGEPICYQNFTTKILEIAKDETGKYYRVKKEI